MQQKHHNTKTGPNPYFPNSSAGNPENWEIEELIQTGKVAPEEAEKNSRKGQKDTKANSIKGTVSN